MDAIVPGQPAQFFELPPQVSMWVNDVLVWIGFGTVVGLLAKAIMPGRDPGGTVATLAMGIAGAVIGCGTASLFLNGRRIIPISIEGLLVATAGAFTLLFFYRMLSGYWFDEGHVEHARPYRRRRTTRRRRRYAVYDD
ncbi:MAG: GlsB/YeaQ/YmgE family stress response membrane protein [Pirellulaceae bacterium]